jgi:hypothetical protein
MHVSELIKKLQAILDEYGDLPVYRYDAVEDLLRKRNLRSIRAAVTDEARYFRQEIQDAPVDTPPDTVII